MREDELSAGEKIANSMKKDISKPLTLSNWSFRKTFIGEWKNFFVFVMLMFLVWSYAHDTSACRDMMENLDEICIKHQSNMINNNFNEINLTLGGDLSGDNRTWSYNQPGSSNNISRDSP